MLDPVPVTDEDLEILARTLYGEARGEPLEGRQGVAWVIRNRVMWRPPQWWGDTVFGVCIKTDQFSCWNVGDPNSAKANGVSVTDPTFLELVAIGDAVMRGEIPDPTKGSTHYERIGAGASWAKGQPVAAILGGQAFYRIGPG